MSINQNNYIKNIKKEKTKIILIRITILLTFIISWELLAKYNIINTFIYSSPTNIVNTIYNLYIQNNLLIHIYTTLYEVLIVFTLGITLGFIIAIILYELPLLNKIIDPFLITLNSLPKVALGPLVIILFGANIKSIIINSLLINLITSITTIYNGLINIDKSKLLLLDTLKASKYQKLKYLIIPNSFNNIIASLKLCISTSLIGVIMAEFLVSKAGIGYLIIYGTQVFNLNLVMSGILLLCILSTSLYYLITIIESTILKNK